MLVDENALFFTAGSVASAIVSVPMVNRRYDPFSPWSLLAVVVWLGNGLRGLALSTGTDGRRSLDDLFLLGHEVSFFIPPAAMYLTGLIALTLGYQASAGTSGGEPLRGPLRRLRVEFHRGTPAVIAVLAVVGFIAFYLYAQRTGGFSLARISAKRTTISGLDVTSEYSSHGELRLLSQLSAMAFWLAVAVSAFDGAKHSLLTARGWVLVGLFVNASLLPIYASSRTEVGYILLVAVAIEVAAGARPQVRQVLRVGAVVIVLLSVMTFLRASAQRADTGSFDVGAAVTSAQEVLVYNRNFGDITTTAHIYGAVPDTLPFARGSTITAWLVAPVPRSLWPEKPVINSGPVIGSVIYGNSRSGVPPGLIGELYWNFGWWGLLGGMALIGVVLQRMSHWLPPVGLRTAPIALAYSVVVLRFGSYLFTSGIGSALFKVFVSSALVALALLLSARFVPVSDARRQDGTKRDRPTPVAQSAWTSVPSAES